MSTRLATVRPHELVVVAGLCFGGYASLLGLLELQDVAARGVVGALRTASLLLTLIIWGAWLTHWVRQPARRQRHWLAVLALLPLVALAGPLLGPPPSDWQVTARVFAAVGIAATCWLPGSSSLGTRPIRKLPASGVAACQRPAGAASCPVRRCPQHASASTECLAVEQRRVLAASGRHPTPTAMGLGVMLTLLCLGWATFGAFAAITGIVPVRLPHGLVVVALVVVVLATWVCWLALWARQQSRPQRTGLAVAGVAPAAVTLVALVDSADRSDQVMLALGLVGVLATCWIPGGWPWRDRWPFTDDWPFAHGADPPEATRMARGGALRDTSGDP